jgi:hypothetical protein
LTFDVLILFKFSINFWTFDVLIFEVLTLSQHYVAGKTLKFSDLQAGLHGQRLSDPG